MNKRGLIKFIFVLIAVFVSLYFMLTNQHSGYYSIFQLVMVSNIILSLTIFMCSKLDNIKKYKFIYDVVLMIMILVSVTYVGYFIYSHVSCYFNPICGMELTTVSAIIYPVILFTILLFSIESIYKETNKTNDIITIIVSLIIIMIHTRYYLEPMFPNKIISNVSYELYSYYYVANNYIYFIIMYLVSMIHYQVNKNS